MGTAWLPAGRGHPHRAAGSVRRVGTPDKIFAFGAFAMFVALWVGFAIALSGDRGFLDSTWEWLRGLPAPLQVIVWVAILPIAVGLWIYESTWPPIVALLLVVGMIAWTFVALAGLVRAFGTGR